MNSRPFHDYVALALLAGFAEDEDIFPLSTLKDVSGSIDELKDRAEQVIGVSISEDSVKSAVRSLSECGLARVTEDQFSGPYFKIYRTKFREFVSAAMTERDDAVGNADEVGGQLRNQSDYPNWRAYKEHELFADYDENGQEWLQRAFAGIRAFVEKNGTVPDGRQTGIPKSYWDKIPASDRIVSIGHNDAAEVLKDLDSVIDELSKDNGDPSDPDFRSRVLGQLKAGKELIIAGHVKFILFREAIINSLAELISKYGPKTIGVIAQKVLEVVLEKLSNWIL